MLIPNRKRKREAEEDQEGTKKYLDKEIASEHEESHMEAQNELPSSSNAGYVPNKTAAQLAFERQVRKTEKTASGASAAMGYRQRVDEYNRRLASYSEHHDLPKVGPG